MNLSTNVTASSVGTTANLLLPLRKIFDLLLATETESISSDTIKETKYIPSSVFDGVNEKYGYEASSECIGRPTSTLTIEATFNVKTTGCRQHTDLPFVTPM